MKLTIYIKNSFLPTLCDIDLTLDKTCFNVMFTSVKRGKNQKIIRVLFENSDVN